MKWSWVWAAIASWIGCAFLGSFGISPSVVLFLSVIGWICIMIAIGGKKGIPFGAAILAFVVCVFIICRIPSLFGIPFNWSESKQLLHNLNYGEVVLVYLGLIMLLFTIGFVIPIYVGRKLWKQQVVWQTKPKGEKGKKEKKERKIRGRAGVS